MAIVRLMLLVLSIAWVFPRDCAGQRYAILAPRTVRAYNTYDLVVTNLAAEEQEFLCEIVDTNETVVGRSSATVNPNQLSTVQIQLEGLEQQSYKLKVWKQQNKVLLNVTELESIDRSYLVLFQTDKPAYKPGDKVQFRVIFLFPNAYPVTDTARPSISITDPDKIRMKQWINASLTSGVFEGSFQLAEYTLHGMWTISASLNQQQYKASFSVKEYTLPLFKIQVEPVPNPYFRCDDTKMSLKISASYVHGGLVRGNATVVVRANYNNYPSQTKEVQRKKVPIVGTKTVDFPMNIVAENCYEERNVWFDVTVTESSTGVSYNTTSAFTVHNNGNVTMEAIDGNDAFFPGQAMWIKVKVSTLDEKPLTKASVTIVYIVQDADSSNAAIPKILTLLTNSNGIIQFSINTTLNTVEVNVDGSYNNHNYSLVSAYPMYEDSAVEYVVLNTHQAYYVYRKNITVNLYSNVKFKRVYYIGYCSGRVCESGVQEVSSPVNNYQFILKATPAIKPQMKLLAFIVKEDGKILSSSIIIQILPTSKTALNITSTLMEPMSDKCTINILAEPDAFVGLLGVDERVVQSSTINNDISQYKLDEAMRAQDDVSNAMWSPYDVFGSVGVTLLTDGYLPDVGFIPHAFGGFERADKTPNHDYSSREDFPETWIWESLKVPNQKISIEKTLPDTITTWVVNGFAVGKVYGLQILKTPLTVKSTKRIFAQLYMPPSMKRLEEVTVHCLVHNYGEATNVSLVVPSWLQPTSLILAEGATKTVPIKLISDRVGKLTVEVIVSRTNGSVIDALKQTISVRPEGLMKTVQDVRILDFRKQSTLKFNLTLPAIENDSTISNGKVTLSVIGTFLNLDSFDLERMVQSYHGNGEESLLFLQSAMAVYDYFQKTKDLQPIIRDKLLSYMEVGYQQLLRYRLDDFSYSLFGNLRMCGGVWFTASTVESLQKLSKYYPVEKSLLTESLDWLMSQSAEDGSFNESCTNVHPHIQRTGGKELSLASSVLFAFVESERAEHYLQVVNKTVSLLLNSTIEDVYLMAKTAYLLTLFNHPASTTMLQTLNKKAVSDGKYRYWEVVNREPTATAHIRDQETTAYALMANIKQNTINQLDMIRVAQWLQKHSFAGDHYVPSLERIIALEALGMVASRINITVPHMHIQAGNLTFQVNSTNQRLLQNSILPKNTRSVSMSAVGSGMVLVKLSYRYSLTKARGSNGKSSNPITTRYPISVNSTRKAMENNKLELHLCFVRCQPLYVYDSGLWKAAIDLPTGYEIDEQPKHYGNATESVILLENKSHVALVWDCRHLLDVCYTITMYARFALKTIPQGSIFLSSFDTKDVVDVYSF
ncbi:CD109 antigen-like [Anopheles marshallii]|uniref:CD109 antigen-like n=1 Tax=Anopheles marshallii TaxID=1521116 RepID=UPI00237BA771|nr:CD109 antigen-like [Anopheles marshallii]